MEYFYDITFWLANDEKKKQINLKDWTDVFEKAEEHYNLIGETARNPKRIINTQIECQFVKLRLSSSMPLSTPTLALRSYSQYLVNTDFGNIAANRNALFRGSWEIVEMKKEDITAPEMIKILAELLISGKKADTELIQNIKMQLIDWRDKQ